ncbi:MAG TPA: pyridoxal phosphate-dependent aminotransferase [Solirubrobacteraceae bacterium]|nr:pyridoxal phosphate-dependent aminotransferase [Solirubrobacteraceae bacterium]
MTSRAAPALAPGALRLGTEGAFAVLARAGELERAGRDVVHLEIGEPGFPTPVHVAEAAFAAIRAGETGYCPAAGIPELREAAAAELSRTRGVAIPRDRVLVANGAKPLLFFAVLATCEPGDEVVHPDPGFPIYESAIRFAGATPVPLVLREADDFAFSVQDLAARLTDRTKLVILNSPQNPTGGVLGRETLAAAADVLRDSTAWVLSDEVYGRLLYDGAFASIATEPGMLERTIVLDSFSKTYAMTGWRCGYAAVPGPLVEPLTRFAINSTSCVPPFVQRAGIAALNGPQDGVAAMLAELRARRDLVVAGLAALPGVSCRVPHGAFYAFPNVEALPLAADALAGRLLEEAGVALLSGTAFGAAGEGHLRLSYATSRARLAEGLERMRTFLAGL